MAVSRALVCILLLSPFLVEGFLTPDHHDDSHLADSSKEKTIWDEWWEEYIKLIETKPADHASLHSVNFEPKPLRDDPETATEDRHTTPPTDPRPLPPLCPSSNSYHAEKDINAMIDHQINENGVADLINGSFYASFILVRDSHEQRLNGFLDWFHHRPTHLKHILQALEHTRLRLDPFVKKIQNDLNKYSKLETSLKSKVEQAARLNKKLQNHKALCELSCDDKNTELLRTRLDIFTPDNYICSSLADLFHNVNRNIKKEIESAESDLTNKRANLDSKLENSVEVVIQKLKSAALNEFGRTMYDILELQDKYFHFEELVKYDLESTITDIENNIDLATLKLKELERNVEKVREQCTKCNNKHNRLSSMRSDKLNSRAITQDQNEVIVAKLVSLKMKSLVSTIEEDLNELFVPIITKLRENNDSTDKVIGDLKSIQNEIADMTKRETEQLEQLRNTVSHLSIINILDVHEKSHHLMETLTEIENECEKILKYYNN